MQHPMTRRLLAATLIAGLAGCGTSSIPGNIDPPEQAAPAPVVPIAPPDPPPERALNSWFHDLSPVLPGVTFDTAALEHYSVPTSEGSVLDTWIRRPPGPDLQPLVLVITPYYGGGDPSLPPNSAALGEPDSAFAQFLIPRGYAVGFMSVGGTGNSGGCFRDGGPVERRQLYDAMEYLASQPWSNGNIAPIGVSYDGTTANELFVEPPPSVKTVVPMEAISDYYRYNYNNGILRGGNGAFTTYYYAIVGAGVAGLEGGVAPTDPQGLAQELAGEPCPEQLEIQRGSVENLAAVDKTPYWYERDAIKLVLDSVTRPRPAMFFIQGFQDANVDPQMADGFLEAVTQTGVSLHVWFGQWVHAYPQPTGGPCAELAPCRGDFFEETLVAWFDQFLKNRETGILDAPAVQLQADDGVWRHEEQWPPATLLSVELYPGAGGTLQGTPDVGSAVYTDSTAAVADQPMLNGSAIEYVSEPLQHDLRLTGLPRLETVALASDTRANLVATLLARAEDGSQRYLNFAAINLNHAVSLDQGDADITGKALPVAVNFFPQDNIVAAGSMLVLHIAGVVPTGATVSGDPGNLLNGGPNLQPIGIGADVSLDLGRTRLVLPVNPGDRVEPLSWLARE
ncbi:MAG TPA: CocE/NonD family hydrolase [Solimonas sp.]|nr:CocE/NonD family hydrolase [Solimonas sp.]